MTEMTLRGSVRLCIQVPGGRLALSVPVNVPLGDLLPAIADHAGQTLREAALSSQGWILQRLGGPPLDDEQNAAALGLQDGELLHLRPRAEALPPVHFDDLVDGIATAVREHGGDWQPAYTRRLLAVAGVILAVTLVFALQFGASPVARAVVAATLGAVALIGALLAVQNGPDDLVGGVCGGSAAALFAQAGVALARAPDLRLPAGAVGLLAGCLLALGIGGTTRPLFATTATAAVLVTGGSALALVTGQGLPQAAAATATAAVLLLLAVPPLALRVAGVRAPALPADAVQLQEDITPMPGPEMLARARVLDNYATACTAAVAALVAGCASLLADQLTISGYAFGAMLCALMLLHARLLARVWQRVPVVLAGVYGWAVLSVSLIRMFPAPGRLAVCSVLALLGGLVLAAARAATGRRFVPYWGRLAELAHSLAAISLVPLLLQVCGAFAAARWLLG